MQITDVHIKLQEIHHELGLNDEPLEMDQTLRSQGYDSLDDVEFFMKAEKAFGLNIPDTRLVDVETPNQLTDLIMELAPTSRTPISPETTTPASS